MFPGTTTSRSSERRQAAAMNTTARMQMSLLATLAPAGILAAFYLRKKVAENLAGLVLPLAIAGLNHGI